MPLSTAERTWVYVTCESCKQATQKSVAWLAVHDALACSVCGHIIDLKNANNRLLIQETADNCARIDVALAKISK